MTRILSSHHRPLAPGGHGEGARPAAREDEARAHIFTLQNQLRLPEGVRFGEVKDTSSADEDLAALRFAASLSVVFIYLLMGFLFESFVLPLSIISTIPLAAIGVGWIHVLRRGPARGGTGAPPCAARGHARAR